MSLRKHKDTIDPLSQVGRQVKELRNRSPKRLARLKASLACTELRKRGHKV